MIKNKWVKFILFVLLMTGFWVLYEMMHAKFFLHSPYHFVLRRDILAPAAVSAAVGYLLYLRE